MLNKKRTFLFLNYTVCLIALFHIVSVSIHFNFDFSTAGRMTHPGMVIAFLSACVLNVARLKESNSSRLFNGASAISNLLTLSLALAFTIQQPVLPKVITTCLMVIITLESLWALTWNKASDALPEQI